MILIWNIIFKYYYYYIFHKLFEIAKNIIISKDVFTTKEKRDKNSNYYYNASTKQKAFKLNKYFLFIIINSYINC